MTWRVEVTTISRKIVWTFEAKTGDQFRQTLNHLGREAGIGFSEVRSVQFQRIAPNGE